MSTSIIRPGMIGGGDGNGLLAPLGVEGHIRTQRQCVLGLIRRAASVGAGIPASEYIPFTDRLSELVGLLIVFADADHAVLLGLVTEWQRTIFDRVRRIGVVGDRDHFLVSDHAVAVPDRIEVFQHIPMNILGFRIKIRHARLDLCKGRQLGEICRYIVVNVIIAAGRFCIGRIRISDLLRNVHPRDCVIVADDLCIASGVIVRDLIWNLTRGPETEFDLRRYPDGVERVLAGVRKRELIARLIHGHTELINTLLRRGPSIELSVGLGRAAGRERHSGPRVCRIHINGRRFGSGAAVQVIFHQVRNPYCVQGCITGLFRYSERISRMIDRSLIRVFRCFIRGPAIKLIVLPCPCIGGKDDIFTRYKRRHSVRCRTVSAVSVKGDRILAPHGIQDDISGLRYRKRTSGLIDRTAAVAVFFRFGPAVEFIIVSCSCIIGKRDLLARLYIADLVGCRFRTAVLVKGNLVGLDLGGCIGTLCRAFKLRNCIDRKPVAVSAFRIIAVIEGRLIPVSQCIVGFTVCIIAAYRVTETDLVRLIMMSYYLDGLGRFRHGQSSAGNIQIMPVSIRYIIKILVCINKLEAPHGKACSGCGRDRSVRVFRIAGSLQSSGVRRSRRCQNRSHDVPCFHPQHDALSIQRCRLLCRRCTFFGRLRRLGHDIDGEVFRLKAEVAVLDAVGDHFAFSGVIDVYDAELLRIRKGRDTHVDRHREKRLDLCAFSTDKGHIHGNQTADRLSCCLLHDLLHASGAYGRQPEPGIPGKGARRSVNVDGYAAHFGVRHIGGIILLIDGMDGHFFLCDRLFGHGFAVLVLPGDKGKAIGRGSFRKCSEQLALRNHPALEFFSVTVHKGDRVFGRACLLIGSADRKASEGGGAEDQSGQFIPDHTEIAVHRLARRIQESQCLTLVQADGLRQGDRRADRAFRRPFRNGGPERERSDRAKEQACSGRIFDTFFVLLFKGSRDHRIRGKKSLSFRIEGNTSQVGLVVQRSDSGTLRLILRKIDIAHGDGIRCIDPQISYIFRKYIGRQQLSYHQNRHGQRQ